MQSCVLATRTSLLRSDARNVLCACLHTNRGREGVHLSRGSHGQQVPLVGVREAVCARAVHSCAQLRTSMPVATASSVDSLHLQAAHTAAPADGALGDPRVLDPTCEHYLLVCGKAVSEGALRSSAVGAVQVFGREVGIARV